jgi:hypothetical protein
MVCVSTAFWLAGHGGLSKSFYIEEEMVVEGEGERRRREVFIRILHLGTAPNISAHKPL